MGYKIQCLRCLLDSEVPGVQIDEGGLCSVTKNRANAKKINASTPYETCTEQLSSFGGLLALIKFLDLINFHKIFNFDYQPHPTNPRCDTITRGLN